MAGAHGVPLGQGKHRCPCLAASFPAAPFLLVSEQKRDVYDRYGKDGLMGAGEWVSRAVGVTAALDMAPSEDPVRVCDPRAPHTWVFPSRALLNSEPLPSSRTRGVQG